MCDCFLYHLTGSHIPFSVMVLVWLGTVAVMECMHTQTEPWFLLSAEGMGLAIGRQ